MKIYVSLPQSRYYSGMPQFNTIKELFVGKLKKYYGKLEVEIVGSLTGSVVVVSVMGQAMYGGHDNEIRKIIGSIVESELGTSDINIRLNYSLFNPKYNPQNECVGGESNRGGYDNVDMNKKKNDDKGKSEEFDYEKLSLNYQASEPRYSFEQVILPKSTRKQIDDAIGIIAVEHKVFDEWGLRTIIPEASTALSFYGPPGTGKSMSAEAVAHKLNKKILKATYADIESKFHGEGPKMVKAIFKAAERDDAVLFLDESDSLLSKRLTNVSDGSAQAINSMRSQLLISLESFKGIVIFATNLVVNYDKAFLSRLINVEFTFPMDEERERIWANHLKGRNIHIPLSNDVNIKKIANDYELCGREIKNAVKNACVTVALEGRNIVSHTDIVYACENAIRERERVYSAKDQTNIANSSITPKQENAIKEAFQAKLDKAKTLDVGNDE